MYADVVKTINEIAPALGLLIAAVGCSAAIWLWWVNRFTIQLRDLKSLNDHLNELKKETKLARLYDSYLRRGLEAADTFFGPCPFGYRAWSVCFMVAFIYPVVLYNVHWALGGSGSLGGIDFITAYPGSQIRITFLTLLPIIVGSPVYFWRSQINRIAKAKYSRIRSLALAIGVAFAGALVFLFGGAGAVAFAFAGVVVFSPSVAGAGVIAVALLGAAAVAVTFAVLQGTVTLQLLAFVVFLILLPLVNSVFDYLSWGITRSLGRMLQRHLSLGRAILLGMVDITVAVALLVTLASGFGFSLVVMNNVLLLGEPMKFEKIVAQAVDGPFSEGLWITAMLFSTLIPTAIHFAFVLMGLISKVRRSRKQEEWVAAIEAVLNPNRPDEDALSEVMCTQIAMGLVFRRMFVFLVCLPASGGLVWLVVELVLRQDIAARLAWFAEKGHHFAGCLTSAT